MGGGCVVTGWHIKASLKEYATWQICIEERLELLAEVKAGEDREHELHEVIYAYRTRLTLSELENRKLRYQLAETTGDGDNLREQLAQWNVKRTLGGPAKPYSDANWSNKFSGPTPPPHDPAISTEVITSE